MAENQIVSLAALTILDAGPAGQIEAAAEAGFTHVGLRLQPLLETDAVVVGDEAREAEVDELLRRHHLKLLEVGVFPIRAGSDVSDWMPVFAYAARLGARFLVCPVEVEDPVEQINAFRRVAVMASPFGLDALVEFNPYSGCTTLGRAQEIVDAVGMPNTGLVIDAFHLSRSGGAPEDLTSVPSELLKLLHFCDAAPLGPEPKAIDELRKESRTARMLPGEGSLWLGELLDVLPDTIPVSVEAPSQSMVGRSAGERAMMSLEATNRVLAARSN